MIRNLANTEFLAKRQEQYPFQCKTGHDPRPETVPIAEVGMFLRVPFARHCVWGFKSQEYLDAFKRLYENEVDSQT